MRYGFIPSPDASMYDIIMDLACTVHCFEGKIILFIYLSSNYQLTYIDLHCFILVQTCHHHFLKISLECECF